MIGTPGVGLWVPDWVLTSSPHRYGAGNGGDVPEVVREEVHRPSSASFLLSALFSDQCRAGAVSRRPRVGATGRFRPDEPRCLIDPVLPDEYPALRPVSCAPRAGRSAGGCIPLTHVA